MEPESVCVKCVLDGPLKLILILSLATGFLSANRLQQRLKTSPPCCPQPPSSILARTQMSRVHFFSSSSRLFRLSSSLCVCLYNNIRNALFCATERGDFMHLEREAPHLHTRSPRLFNYIAHLARQNKLRSFSHIDFTLIYEILWQLNIRLFFCKIDFYPSS